MWKDAVSDRLEAGYSVRRPNLTDASPVHELIVAMEAAEFGEPDDYRLDDLLDDWQQFDLARDAWIIVAPDGAVAGYGYARRHQIVRNDVEGYVHPAHHGRGIGTTLVRLGEAWAREAVPLAPAGAEVFVTNWINSRNAAACSLLAHEGYCAVRYFWRMGIDLDATFAPQPWPAGITVRTAAEIGNLHPFHETVEECMADHWGHVTRPFEEWVERRCGTDFDPRLWFLALDGEIPAGAVLCKLSDDSGEVDTLVVRRDYRRQGLGSALLSFAFGALAGQERTRIRLTVDAENLTGATRLYERAGMQVVQEYAAYRKTLREGG